MPSFPNFSTCKKIGFIVPSSNAVVEPITSAFFQSLDSNNDVICLFTRLRVQTLGVDADATSQFATAPMVAAAKLLADAQVDAILWNGTSGMWTGDDVEADRALAAAMQDATGVPCSTTTLATLEALALEPLKGRRLGIAVPYTQELTQQVRSFFAKAGFSAQLGSVARLDPTPATNGDIAKTSRQEIRSVVQQAAAAAANDARQGVTVVVVACTNWPAATMIEDLERDTGAVIVDSVLVTIWQGLRMIGYRANQPIGGWGVLFNGMVSS